MAQISRYRYGRDLLSQLQSDFNQLLSPFERNGYELTEGAGVEWVPSIDVKEEEKKYIIHADVPGVKVTDIELSMENGVLTIKGKRKFEYKEEEENYLRIERSSGSFLRQFALPEAVDQEKIEAECHDGVLIITLPKSTKGSGRKITVKGS